MSGRFLLLRWEAACCVVLASEVASVQAAGPAATVALAPHVPGAVDDPARHAPMVLLVRTAAGTVGFRAAARVEIHERLRCYALPRFLRAGSPSWLRGLALDPDAAERPVPWLDLGALGRHHRHQAHLACAEGRA